MPIKKFSKEELGKMKDLTDYERLKRMTEEEIEEAAKSDPDVPHLSEEELKRFKRVKRNRNSESEKTKIVDREAATDIENPILKNVRFSRINNKGNSN